jgi:hypothetical protein
MTDKKRRHPNSGDLYTPVGPQFYALLEQMKLEYGSWRVVAWKSELRMKQLRGYREGKRKAISLRVLDRMITASGVGNLGDFVFFTAEDLVKLGIWKEPFYVEGQLRIQGDTVREVPKMNPQERERLARKKRRIKKAAKKKKERDEAKAQRALWRKRNRPGLW